MGALARRAAETINTATPMPGLFCAVPAFSDSTLFHAVPARSDATALAFPITTASRWSAIWLARPCPRGIGAGRPTLGRSTTRFARGILPASSALCREAVDAGAVATGAKIKPGESGEALHREPLNAGEVRAPRRAPPRRVLGGDRRGGLGSGISITDPYAQREPAGREPGLTLASFPSPASDVARFRAGPATRRGRRTLGFLPVNF